MARVSTTPRTHIPVPMTVARGVPCLTATSRLQPFLVTEPTGTRPAAAARSCRRSPVHGAPFSYNPVSPGEAHACVRDENRTGHGIRTVGSHLPFQGPRILAAESRYTFECLKLLVGDDAVVDGCLDQLAEVLGMGPGATLAVQAGDVRDLVEEAIRRVKRLEFADDRIDVLVPSPIVGRNSVIFSPGSARPNNLGYQE